MFHCALSNLFEVLGRDKLYGTGPFEEMDTETAKSILEEMTRLSENELAESFTDADPNPPVFDPDPVPDLGLPPPHSRIRRGDPLSNGRAAHPRPRLGDMCLHASVNQQNASPTELSSPCRIRRRDASDLDRCVHVLTEVHGDDGYPVNWPECPSEWLMQPSLLAAWVAELDGQVVGHIGLSRSGEGDAAPALWSRRAGVPVESTAVISRLFVSPAARGHGIGARLMMRAVEDAQQRALHPVLDVLASDRSAAALYERLGWTLLATVDQQWSPTQTVTVHCFAAPA